MLNLPRFADRAAVRELHRKLDRLLQRDRAASAASEPLVFRRLLAAIDGSPASRHVLAWARELSAAFDASVDLVTVLPTPGVYEAYARFADGPGVRGSTLHGRAEAQARRLLDRARRLGDGKRPVKVHLLEGDAPSEIVALAKRIGADLILLGSHSRGALGRIVLGSVADAVKARSPCSVLIARGPPRTRSVLVPTDGSSASRGAVSVATRLARRWKGHATLLHAIDHPLFVRPAASTRRFDGAFGPVGASHDPAVDCHVAFSAPTKAILREAESEGAGLIVLASRGLTGLSGALARSVSNRVAHEAPSSVLLVKPGVRS